MEISAQLQLLLQSPKNIVITTHHKPDGDALGSSLGLKYFLEKLNHKVSVISPSDFPYFLDWLPGASEVHIYKPENTEVKNLTLNADIIFCLDFNHLSRVYDYQHWLAESKAYKVMIDHHLEPQGFEDARYWRTSACATAELVLDFIQDLGQSVLVDDRIATCLYTGIMTDSGSFRFESTTADLHRKVAFLIEKGADNAEIHRRVYDTVTESKVRVLGYCLSNKLEIIPEYHTAILSLSKEELDGFKVGTGDTEGIVNYGLAIQGIYMAVFIVERPELVKLSFRSIGSVPANEIAAKYFKGGGHKNAAGGQSTDSLESTINKVKSVLPEYLEILKSQE
jgi:bifunctional oligoribonuclease and PAP phosphatase NrnA